MMGEAKKNSTAADNYLDYIMEIVKGNEGFLRENAEETYGEVIELVNDSIDLIEFAVKREKSREDYVKRSMAFFIYHILMSSSYAIYANLLIGNLPACFMELRLILESLVKCYLADLKYPDPAFFQEGLKLLEREINKERISTTKLMEDLGEKLGLKSDFVALWGKLSQSWLHTKGVVDRVVSQVIEKSGVPPWALTIPMNYAEADLDTIEELRKRVAQFRDLLRVTIDL